MAIIIAFIIGAGSAPFLMRALNRSDESIYTLKRISELFGFNAFFEFLLSLLILALLAIGTICAALDMRQIGAKDFDDGKIVKTIVYESAADSTATPVKVDSTYKYKSD